METVGWHSKLWHEVHVPPRALFSHPQKIVRDPLPVGQEIQKHLSSVHLNATCVRSGRCHLLGLPKTEDKPRMATSGSIGMLPSTTFQKDPQEMETKTSRPGVSNRRVLNMPVWMGTLVGISRLQEKPRAWVTRPFFRFFFVSPHQTCQKGPV